MRKLVAPIIASMVLAAPAQAVGLGDLAKVVLGGGSVLKKAETKCAKSSFSLNKNEQLALTFARAAAEQALPISEFQSLDQAAEADATKAAEAQSFCPETKKNKTGLLSKIKKAGKALATKKMLGL